MRSSPVSWFHLSFLLPKGIGSQAVDDGFAAPDCKIRVAHPLVKIIGPSREAVFDAASGLLRSLVRRRGPLSISASLLTPCSAGCGSDGWTIIVGADVAFSPTAIDPFFPRGQDGATDAAQALD